MEPGEGPTRFVLPVRVNTLEAIVLMKTAFVFFFLTLSLTAAAASTPAGPLQRNLREPDHPVLEPAESAEPAPDGFVPLFNGVNLDGWEVRHAENRDWRVVGGVIDCDPHEGPDDRNLWTRRSFGDFELLVDWRIKEAPYTITVTARMEHGVPRSSSSAATSGRCRQINRPG